MLSTSQRINISWTNKISHFLPLVLYHFLNFPYTTLIYFRATDLSCYVSFFYILTNFNRPFLHKISLTAIRWRWSHFSLRDVRHILYEHRHLSPPPVSAGCCVLLRPFTTLNLIRIIGRFNYCSRQPYAVTFCTGCTPVKMVSAHAATQWGDKTVVYSIHQSKAASICSRENFSGQISTIFALKMSRDGVPRWSSLRKINRHSLDFAFPNQSVPKGFLSGNLLDNAVYIHLLLYSLTIMRMPLAYRMHMVVAYGCVCRADNNNIFVLRYFMVNDGLYDFYVMCICFLSRFKSFTFMQTFPGCYIS